MYSHKHRRQQHVLLLTVGLILFGLFTFIIVARLRPKPNRISPKLPQPTISETLPITSSTFSIFVPYWSLEETGPITLPSLSNLSTTRPTLIYFGITPTLSGINQEDIGYRNIAKFMTLIPDKSKKLLTIRMLNDSQTTAILENENNQAMIITQAIEMAQKYGFDGIILDLEIKAIPTEKVVSQITKFARRFSIMATEKHLEFGMTAYGDTFYRARPFDLKGLEPFVDQFYIMAYDFSKSFGTPGPNFPLQGRETFGYDLAMLANNLSFIPPKKLTFIFGMYGYDWLVDEKKRPIRPANALPLKTIKEQFLKKCEKKNCVVLRNTQASEGEIDYVDNLAQYHIIWFEDETSVSQKIDFLKTKGISNFSFWVWGYY